jgi:hypothetical protein
MARLEQADDPERPGGAGAGAPSIWTAIHPRLLELVRAHRSTLVFVNSRRSPNGWRRAQRAGGRAARARAPRLARAPAAHRDRGRLKAGLLRGLVATSSLELGIDMGAIDLVVQIEAPPSVASGLQRIGRAGHHVGAASRGVIVPEVPRRPRRLRGGDARDARRRRSSDALPAQPARRARPADRRDGRHGRLERRRPLRRRPLGGAVRGSEPRAVRGRARHARRPLPVGRFRRAAPADHLGPPVGHARGREGAARRRRQRRHDPGPRAVRRVPRRRRSEEAARASASSTRRWSSRAASARRSCSAPRPGASRRSRTTACSCRRAGRARQDAVLEGRRRRPPARTRPRSANWCARSQLPAAPRSSASCATTTSPRAPPNLLAYLPSRPSSRRRCPTTARSSSSAAATSWATGASACCRRSAGGCWRPGRWPPPRGSAKSAASTSRRCGPTRASWCGFPKPTSRPIPR